MLLKFSLETELLIVLGNFADVGLVVSCNCATRLEYPATVDDDCTGEFGLFQIKPIK